MAADFLVSLGMGIIIYFVFLFPLICLMIGTLCGLLKMKSWKTTVSTIMFFFFIFIYYSWILNQGESSSEFIATAPYEYLIYYGGLTFGANQFVLYIKNKKKTTQQ